LRREYPTKGHALELEPITNRGQIPFRPVPKIRVAATNELIKVAVENPRAGLESITIRGVWRIDGLGTPAFPRVTTGETPQIVMLSCYVTRRKVSAGTRSDVGRDCRDAFLGLAKTCDKLGIAVWDYLGSRLKVAGHIVVQPLDRHVRGRFRPA
jgi:hypothetical protein